MRVAIEQRFGDTNDTSDRLRRFLQVGVGLMSLLPRLCLTAPLAGPYGAVAAPILAPTPYYYPYSNLCPYGLSSSQLIQYGQGVVNTFKDGPLDFSTGRYEVVRSDAEVTYREPTMECIQKLGQYDPVSGVLTSNNYNSPLQGYVLDGKYMETAAVVSSPPPVSRYAHCDNDFRTDYRGEGNIGPDLGPTPYPDEGGGYGGGSNCPPGRVPPRESLFAFNEASAYRTIGDFRARILSDNFIAKLGLSTDRTRDLKHSSYRPDLQIPSGYSGTVRLARPKVLIEEALSLGNVVSLFPENQITIPFLKRNDPPGTTKIVSKAFEPDAVIAGYGALLAKLVTATNVAMVEDPNFPTSQCNGTPSFPPTDLSCRFTRDITPILPQALGLFAASVYKNSSHILRYNGWANRYSRASQCGERTAYSPKCDQGINLDNAMMFDESVKDPWTVIAGSKRRVFPFFVVNYGGNWLEVEGKDASATFVASLFYHLAHGVGLGNEKALLLFLKTLSLIGPSHMPGGGTYPLPMRRFGRLILKAAAMLWPDPQNPAASIYYEEILAGLRAKGIAAQLRFVCSEVPDEDCCSTPDPYCRPIGDSATDPDFFIPAGIGSYPNDFEWDDRAHFTSQGVSAPNFGSLIPDNGQPSGQDEGGDYAVWWNGYRPNFSPPPSYVAYQFHRASRYGPCDYLALANANPNESPAARKSFDSFGMYRARSSVYWEARGKDLENRVVFFPNEPIHWQRFRAACESDGQGYYTEDVTPFGFRVVSAVADGFSFQVTKIAEISTRVRYSFQIVDPSQLAGDQYTWTFSTYAPYLSTVQRQTFTVNPSSTNQFGRLVTQIFYKDQPITITVQRNRSGQIQTLSIPDRTNDLSRENGQAFYKDLRPTSSRQYGFDRIGDGDWDTVYNHCDPSVAKPDNGQIEGHAAATWYTPAEPVKVKRLWALVSAEVGSANPTGVVDFGSFQWVVNIWEDRLLWNECVDDRIGCNGGEWGHVLHQVYSQPSYGSVTVPFGKLDQTRSSYLVGFDIESLPGDVVLYANWEYVISLHAESDWDTNGALCIIETDVGKTFTSGGTQPASDLIYGDYPGLGGPTTLYLHRKISGDFSPCRFAYWLETEQWEPP